MSEDGRPNILCFVTDQQRADHLDCYGNTTVQTPNIDRVAAEGVTFNHAYVSNPLCMPNRASLFTGMVPKAHGVRENGIALDRSHPVLPELLRQAGYQTGSFGKLHLTPFAIDQHTPLEDWESYETPGYWSYQDHIPTLYYGFESVYYVGGHGPYTFGEYVSDIGPNAHRRLGIDAALESPSGAKESWKASIAEADHYNTRIADKTIDFLRNRDTSRPFFAWCSFPDPHHPYMPPAPYCHQYDPQNIDFDPARRDGELEDLPPYFRQAREGEIALGGLRGGAQITDAQYREILGHTYGMISMIDANVGRVVDALEAEGILENTIIVFMSDHGDLMGDHWLINKGPFLFRGLVRVPMIWRVPQSANNGHHTEAIVSAVDFAPTVLDLTGVEIPTEMQGASFGGVLAGDTDAHREAAYIEYDSSYLNDRLRSLRTAEWAITLYTNNDYGLLYDLKHDPNELQNLWDDEAHQPTKYQLLAQLLQTSAGFDSWQPEKKAHA